jgi:ribosome-binding factor A
VKYSQQRLAQEIKSRLATILREKVADPRLELFTIADVEVAPDASFARIFFRTLGDLAETSKAIEKAKPYIRRCLAAELKVRRVPELDFRADLTLDRAARIEQVLREVAHPGAASPVTDETEDEEEPA